MSAQEPEIVPQQPAPSLMDEGEFASRIKAKHPALWSEKQAGQMLQEIQSSPLAPARQESGLYLADYLPRPEPLSNREENFMSNLVGRIPGVRGSQRQFTVFLDKIRADAFDNYATTNPDATPETLSGVARFINYSTGRGDMGSFGVNPLSNDFGTIKVGNTRLSLWGGTNQLARYTAQLMVGQSAAAGSNQESLRRAESWR